MKEADKSRKALEDIKAFIFQNPGILTIAQRKIVDRATCLPMVMDKWTKAQLTARYNGSKESQYPQITISHKEGRVHSTSLP
jgi:hypothetical protein